MIELRRGSRRAAVRVFVVPALALGLVSAGTDTRTAPLSIALPSRQDTEWRRALPGYRYVFPRDHGSHPEFATEWWYYTGRLETGAGSEYGFQLTFFRVGVSRDSDPSETGARREGGPVSGGGAAPDRWRLTDLYLAHFAVSDFAGKKLMLAERRNRAGPGTAGAATDSLRVFLEDWSVAAEGIAHRLRALGEDTSIDLIAEPEGPPVIHGRDGVSRKAGTEGHASHYYSIPRLRVGGSLTVRGRTSRVTGVAWMDHEFGSDPLAEGMSGWDWMGLRLDDGSDLMLYRLRGVEGPYLEGTLVLSDGKVVPLDSTNARMTPSRIWKSPETGARYPVEWRVEIESHGIRLAVLPSFDAQELRTDRSTRVTYWEGSVEARGTAGGGNVSGEGYLELTGYAGRNEIGLPE